MNTPDTTIEKSSGNVFADLGFDAEEAQHLVLRSELMRAIRKHVESSGQTQQQAARLFGVTQPRLNMVLKGRINEFSLDALVSMLAKAGMRVELKVKKAPARKGRMNAPMNHLGVHDPAPVGELLAGWLQDLNMTAPAFAAHLGIGRAMLSRILNGRAAMTADMDMRLSEALGTKPGYWLRLQLQHALWTASQCEKERAPVADRAPIPRIAA